MKVEAKVQFEAVDSENVKGQTQTTATGGNRTMNSNSTFTASRSVQFAALPRDAHSGLGSPLLPIEENADGAA